MIFVVSNCSLAVRRKQVPGRAPTLQMRVCIEDPLAALTKTTRVLVGLRTLRPCWLATRSGKPTSDRNSQTRQMKRPRVIPKAQESNRECSSRTSSSL